MHINLSDSFFTRLVSTDFKIQMVVLPGEEMRPKEKKWKNENKEKIKKRKRKEKKHRQIPEGKKEQLCCINFNTKIKLPLKH